MIPATAILFLLTLLVVLDAAAPADR